MCNRGLKRTQRLIIFRPITPLCALARANLCNCRGTFCVGQVMQWLWPSCRCSVMQRPCVKTRVYTFQIVLFIKTTGVSVYQIDLFIPLIFEDHGFNQIDNVQDHDTIVPSYVRYIPQWQPLVGSDMGAYAEAPTPTPTPTHANRQLTQTGRSDRGRLLWK